MTGSAKRRKRKQQRKTRNRRKPTRHGRGWHIAAGESPVKMSEVIDHVAQPLLDELAHTPEDVEKIISMVISAWNIALFPEESKKEQFNEIARKSFGHDRELIAIWQSLCALVAERKQLLYPRLNRFIVDVKFRREDNGEVYFEVMHTQWKEEGEKD